MCVSELQVVRAQTLSLEEISQTEEVLGTATVGEQKTRRFGSYIPRFDCMPCNRFFNRILSLQDMCMHSSRVLLGHVWQVQQCKCRTSCYTAVFLNVCRIQTVPTEDFVQSSLLQACSRASSLTTPGNCSCLLSLFRRSSAIVAKACTCNNDNPEKWCLKAKSEA